MTALGVPRTISAAFRSVSICGQKDPGIKLRDAPCHRETTALRALRSGRHGSADRRRFTQMKTENHGAGCSRMANKYTAPYRYSFCDLPSFILRHQGRGRPRRPHSASAHDQCSLLICVNRCESVDKKGSSRICGIEASRMLASIVRWAAMQRFTEYAKL